MQMKLSKNREKLVLNNRNLVYFFLKKIGITKKNREYDDLVSIGTIGLIKAAITYDISKGNAFSTYAMKCIENEIYMHFRCENNRKESLSLNGFVRKDNEVTDKEYEGILDSKSYFINDIVDKEDFIYILSIILNCITGDKRVAMLFSISDMTQQEIGYEMNVSQSYASRLIKMAINEIKEIIDLQLRYYEIFSVSAYKNAYRLCFSIENIDKFKEIFTMFLEKNIKTGTMPDFSISFKGKRIIIQFSACEEFFHFIAKMLQEMDDFTLFLSSSDIEMLAENKPYITKKTHRKRDIK